MLETNEANIEAIHTGIAKARDVVLLAAAELEASGLAVQRARDHVAIAQKDADAARDAAAYAETMQADHLAASIEAGATTDATADDAAAVALSIAERKLATAQRALATLEAKHAAIEARHAKATLALEAEARKLLKIEQARELEKFQQAVDALEVLAVKVRPLVPHPLHRARGGSLAISPVAEKVLAALVEPPDLLDVPVNQLQAYNVKSLFETGADVWAPTLAAIIEGKQAA